MLQRTIKPDRSTKENEEEIMEVVMFLTMLLFTGGCTLIMVVAALHINSNKENESLLEDETEQTSRHSRKTLV
jgi:hypothetical protein